MIELFFADGIAAVGAPSSSSSSSSSSAGAGGKETDMAIGGRKIGENKLLNKSARNTYAHVGSRDQDPHRSRISIYLSIRFEPYSIKCKVCKQKIHQAGSHYCQQCAYKLGT